jgi:hypothetical protein
VQLLLCALFNEWTRPLAIPPATLLLSLRQRSPSLNIQLTAPSWYGESAKSFEKLVDDCCIGDELLDGVGSSNSKESSESVVIQQYQVRLAPNLPRSHAACKVALPLTRNDWLRLCQILRGTTKKIACLPSPSPRLTLSDSPL